MTFKELKILYDKHFSLGYLSTNINNKFALISLVGYIVHSLKKKNPDVSYYSVLYKLSEGLGLKEEDIFKMAIICEDFAYNCDEFPTFGLKPNEIKEKIREILSKYLPF